MRLSRIRLVVDLFTAAMVASVALALAGLTWRLAGYTGDMPVAAPVAARASLAPVDVDGIVALAPFGTALSAGQAAGGGAIRLKGILLAIPAAASTALIAGPDGKVASYGIGATIDGGVVAAIEPDRVIVRMPGGLQALNFVAGAPNNAAIPAGSPLAPLGAKAGPTAIVPGVDGSGFQAGGFQVGASSPPALFAAGLRPGDVVEQVNGTPVGAALDARDLIARVAQAGSAQVVVVRNGQRLSLSLAMH